MSVTADNKEKILRGLPSVQKFLNGSAGRELCSRFGEGVTKHELRRLISALRESITDGATTEVPSSEQIAALIEAELLRFAAPGGKRAINATGVLLHTGLGRAPLAAAAVEALALPGYSILQVDVDSGGRSKRDTKCEEMLKELTGCQAATIVNNNAAATFLILTAIACGKEVIVSRGQLVEIGGSYRMPDVMARSGAILREVGTTNRTHISDYQEGINSNTGAILYVHPSNYKIQGFSGTPSLAELCCLGRENQLPVISDLGSGAIVSLDAYGLGNNLTIAESISAGAAICCSSGDKLLGGPQSGIICGRADLVQAVRKNPFARMFRVGKLTLVGLETTLVSYINNTYHLDLPLYQMLGQSIGELEAKAQRLIGALRETRGVVLKAEESLAYVGGGALPDESIPSVVVALEFAVSGQENLLAERASKMLRQGVPSVFCRVKEQRLLFDMRTVAETEIDQLTGQIRQVVGQLVGGISSDGQANG